MARKNTIRLLLINASDNDSERLVSLFRSAGRVARAERVDSANELERALQKPWDLLIADDHHPELAVETCLEHLRRVAVDLPVIVQRADADLAALFAAGARDVIAPGEDLRLVCAAVRELETVDLRRHAAKLSKQLEEAEQRNALLLGEADQAIAYLADGMVVSANSLFAQRFGHAQESELDCVPIVDLVALSDHERFKASLKAGDGAQFNFTGQSSDGSTFEATMRLNSAILDDEPCTQLIIENRSQAVLAGSVERDEDTGAYSKSYLLSELAKHSSGSLLVIGIDQFVQLRRQLGFAASGLFVADLADFVETFEPLQGAALARLSEDHLALLLPGQDSARALEWAALLCRAVEAHIFERDGQSRQCTLSVGVVALGSGNGSASEVIDQAVVACEKVRTDADKDGIGNGAGQYVATRAKRSVRPSGGEHQPSLEAALEQQRFALLFQPIISLRGASGEHYEVLLRMRGDTDALQAPDNFLDALGPSANNAKLDRWIFLEATKRLAENRSKGNDTRLVLNLTVNALLDESLAPWLGVALKAAGLPAAALIVQLRETDVINYLKPAKAFAEALRQLGCRFSIAGFGGVLDPLKTLKTLPTDMIQIDGNFTRELQTSGNPQALKALVSAVGGLEVQVIIPFVENASVLATLWQVGADFIQGHYLQAPSRDMNYEFTDIA